ncbi:hypothetical protein LSH36_882g00059 [Paralvinella palmiformis]|uniref:Ricin B lectin domain-containing protein n=1 Tax=Paralvinella palmiformis TaxID=53620 RepID=A0AAD9IYU7_9ANNE|nr:hypothetical protein LSH36_882g00059 [Paralvinella palmiformis]
MEIVPRSVLQKKKFGDLGYIMKVRKELGCRTFRWFLNNIATHKRIPNIKDISHYGQLLSVSDGRCLDTLSSKNRSPMGLYQCVSKAISTQDTKELLHSSGLCLDATDPKRKEHPFNYVTLIKCNGEPSQKWRWQDKKWPT